MLTETLTIRISREEALELRRRARRERVSVGKLVRRNLHEIGLTPPPAANKPKSGYDVVKHLVGICKGGTRDLATNPKYMEGFGQ
jgi:hypothetical protein